MAESLAKQLKNVKLKKSKEPIKDYSSPKMTGFTTKEEIRSYEDSVLDVNTEQWMHLLTDVTFPTVTCPFTLDDARLFLEIYKRLFLDKDAEISKAVEWQSKLTGVESAHIMELEDRLDKAMHVYTNEGHAFVKLSSRSAKDAPLLQTKLKGIYETKKMAFPVDKRETENTKIFCLLQAGFDAMKVKKAIEVIDMFVRSERVYQDLLLAAVNRPEVYNTNFVIRKFVHIDVDMEFRGFVFKGKLNALSQYNYLVYSEKLVAKKKSLTEKMLEFYEKEVAPKLSSAKFPNDYIIDFAVCNTDEQEDMWKLWVIEINPFLVTTDGALFSWEHEYDILTGKHGFQFRIVTQTKPGSIKMMPQSVRSLVT